MGRIFEPAPITKKHPDLLAMNCLKVHHVADHYKRTKEGYEVNDGKYLEKINDKEEEVES